MANISIDVRKKTIQELIDDEIPSGKYWLPSFQRQYVWDSDNVKELLDSIVRNYPIGATILWKPSPEVASEIDPTSAPIFDSAPVSTKDRYFIIDGQQRITSILLLFNNWTIQRGGEQVLCDPIAYDPASDKFIKHRNRGIDCSKIVKAFCYHDVDTLTELKNQYNPNDFNKIRIIAQKILDYPIPQYVMESSGEENEREDIFSKMAEAFIRINKEGMRIGSVELMLSFMAGTLSGALKERVLKLYKEFEKRDAMIQPIIRSVFSNFDLSQTKLGKPKQFKANIESIRQIPADDLNRRLIASEHALRLSFEFIEKEFGMRNIRLLPSQVTLIPLTTYFTKVKIESMDMMPPQDRDAMKSWFILSNLNGRYSKSPDSRLNRDIKMIQEYDGFPFKEMRDALKVQRVIDIEYVRDGIELSALREANKTLVFLLYTLLFRNNADDWGGRLIASRDLKELERHHIFPREYLQEQLELDDVDDVDKTEAEISNLANITFILKEVNASINDTPPVSYMPQYIERAKLHFIPEDKMFWTKEAYDNGSFQDARIKLIFEAAQKYFPDVFV